MRLSPRPGARGRLGPALAGMAAEALYVAALAAVALAIAAAGSLLR